MKTYSITSLLFTFLSCTTLLAATVEWTGSISTDWHTPGNWDCNCLPTAADDVVIGLNQEVVLDNLDAVTIRSLSTRGILTVLAQSALEIDGQGLTMGAGLQISNGTLINHGDLRLRNHNNVSSLSVGGNAVFENEGEVLIRDVICTEGNCSAFEVLALDGHFINRGNFIVRNIQGMDGASVRQNFSNDGTFVIDSIQSSSLNVFRISSEATFSNGDAGIFELSNVISTGGISRCFGNVQNNVTIDNAGDIVLSNLGEDVWSMDIKGTQTLLMNTGGISVEGGEFALLLQDEAVFFNEGVLQASGQADSGLKINSGADMNNAGTIILSVASASSGVEISTQTPGVGLLNTGTITLDSYLNGSESAAGISVFNGLFDNQGPLNIQGSGAGIGVRVSENAALANAGALALDALTFGLWLETSITNTGTIHFGEVISETPITNTPNAVVENSGTISGFGEFSAAQFNFMSGTSLVPGTETQTTIFHFTDALLLPEEASILLDIAATDAAPDAYDRIVTQGEMAFSGELNVSLSEGFGSTAGSFVLLESAVALSGNPVVNLPPAPAGKDWRIEQNSNSIVLHLDLVNDVNEQWVTTAILYPNPVSTSAQIHWRGDAAITDTVEFTLYTRDGQCLARRVGQGHQVTLGFTEVPAGTYLLRWTAERTTGVCLVVFH